MFFQISNAAAGDEGLHHPFSAPSISPLLGTGGQMQNAATSMNISNSISLLSPFYHPLGHHLSSAFFLPSLLGSTPADPFLNGLLNAASSVPPQHRKLFIGGLNPETTDEELREYYSKWGQVVDCIVIRDPVTRRSRCFGFVTFATAEMADDAMADRPHEIGGKTVDPKRAIPREQMLQASNCPPAFLDVEFPTDCKLILSGITSQTVDILRQYFERFGELEQVEISGQSGFGFIVYESRSGVKKCLARGKVHLINDRKVQVQEADKDESLSPPVSFFRSHGSRMHRKRFGGGREKSGNSIGSHESQIHSPDSTQSETEQSN